MSASFNGSGGEWRSGSSQMSSGSGIIRGRRNWPSILLFAAYLGLAMGIHQMEGGVEQQELPKVQQKKRAIWQIHLSSLILAMLLCSAFLYFNARPIEIPEFPQFPELHTRRKYFVYGWPFQVCTERWAPIAGNPNETKYSSTVVTWNYAGLAGDIAVSMIGICLPVVFLERRARTNVPSK
jgi:hypothetical protein